MAINYAGTGTDPEDGTLPASAFTWQVDFHHDTHTHPFMPPTTGATSGSFTIPTTGETSANVWYRIYLTVRDSGGLTHTTFRDVLPRKVQLTLATNPAGLQLDARRPAASPRRSTFDGVVGIVRTHRGAAPQTSGGTTYDFVSWSDGGAASHNISTPAADTTYTATYRVAPAAPAPACRRPTSTTPNFTGTTVTRIDPTVNFDWGAGSPAAGIGADTFSARWTGQVSRSSPRPTRSTRTSDDGVRLWVNGQLRRQQLDRPRRHREQRHDRADRRAALRHPDGVLREHAAPPTARLLWSSAVDAEGGRAERAALPGGAAAVDDPDQLPARGGAGAGRLPDGRRPASTAPAATARPTAGTPTTRRRRATANSSLSPDQRYDTLDHMQRPANPERDLGDRGAERHLPRPHRRRRCRATSTASYRIDGEGVLTVSGTPNSATRWVEGTATVTVTDGRLTIRTRAGASNNKICFVEITPP